MRRKPHNQKVKLTKVEAIATAPRLVALVMRPAIAVSASDNRGTLMLDIMLGIASFNIVLFIFINTWSAKLHHSFSFLTSPAFGDN